MTSGKTISVTNVDFSVAWPTHDSFKGAVDAVPRSRREQARDVNRQLEGSSVQSCSYNGARVSLRMSRGDELVLTATATGVDWELNPEASPPDPSLCPPEQMRIRFPQGLEYDWYWRAWLEGLYGNKFCAIAPSETTVSLLVRDAPELLFDSLVMLETGRRFLFFSES